jgi:tetratricopeptide (TPR) repeat protein
VGQPFWSVPHPRNAFFTGRDEVVAEIRKRLTGSRKAALAQAISGLGGIGKTQTAVEYAYRYRDEYQAVLWLDAESPLALKAGCGELARRLHLPHQENDLDQAVLALKQWLAREPGWLLIFDNADDPDALEPLFPDAEHGHLLVTSRALDFQDLGIINPVQLEEWPVADATTFLLDRCHRQDPDSDEREAAEQLARELDGLPLALEQAAAYIVERRATFRRYLESYRNRGLKLFDARLPALGRYEKSVTTTWVANFEAVQEDSPAAADVLRVSAFLAPAAIPFELLTRGASELGTPVRDALAEADTDTLLVNDLLWSLGRFSLIRVDGNAETYSIHRMVQEVTRFLMEKDARRNWAERAVRAVNQAFPVPDHNNRVTCGRLLSHALTTASWIEADHMDFPEAGTSLNNSALYLFNQAQYADAEPLLLRAIEIYRSALGEEHPDYATSLSNLAGLRRATGCYGEAEPLFLRAIEIYRRARWERHPDYATALNNLAGMYRVMGRYPDAERFFKQAMEITRASQGEEHPDYAQALNNLGVLYQAMGRYGEAESLLLGAADIIHTARGEEHPDYAISLSNLGVLYRAMGRYDLAEPRLLRAMSITDTALRKGHPNHAVSLINLGELHREVGRYDLAEPLFREALEIRRTALGEGHPDYAQALNNLALLYHAMDRHTDAEPLLLRAREITLAALGEGHPTYAQALNNLAELYLKTGRYREAQPLYEQARDIRRAALGEGHPDYAQSLNNLAGLYFRTRRYGEAETLYDQALAIRCAALGEGHPDYAQSLNNLATLYGARGRHGEAGPLLRQAIAILRATLGTSHPSYQGVLNNYRTHQRQAGRPVPGGRIPAAGDDGLPAPPSEAAKGDVGSDAPGA